MHGTAMDIQEITTQKTLSPTGITIADYVINPYRGCAMGCHYCYAKRNKNTEQKEWGNFVEVKTNTIQQLKQDLEQELRTRTSIERVLIGSTTEVYQPLEKRYQFMPDILKLLQEHNIACTILTRSPLITRDISLLKQNPKNKVCFTLTPLTDQHLRHFEMRTAGIDQRLKAIQTLSENQIQTYVYIAPLLPWIGTLEPILEKSALLKDLPIDIEIYNGSKDAGFLLELYQKHAPELACSFKEIYSNETLYQDHWDKQKQSLLKQWPQTLLPPKIHIHPLKNFFRNTEEQYERYQ